MRIKLLKSVNGIRYKGNIGDVITINPNDLPAFIRQNATNGPINEEKPEEEKPDKPKKNK